MSKVVKYTAKAKPKARPKFVWRKRDGQDSRLYNLKLDINEIKQEIARLATVRQLVQPCTLNRHDELDGSCQKVVIEYFKVFANGFVASPYNTVSYIYHVMSEDIQVNNFQGRAMVVEQWKMHSATFENLDFRFVDAMVIPLSDSRAVVKCTAHFSSLITCRTLAIMFPHIMHRDDLIEKLVGKPVAGFGRYDFQVDAKTMQITRCDVVLDYLSCFAKLLKNPVDLAFLFGQALLVDEFYIGDVDDHAPVPEPKVVEVVHDDCDCTSSNRSAEVVSSPAYPSPPESGSSEKMRLDHILGGVNEEGEEEEPQHAATRVRAGNAY